MRAPWTEQELRIEAAKYDSRKAFHVGNQAACNAARRLGLLDTLIASKLRLWDETSIREEALKYSSKAAFAAGCRGGYGAARALGLLDQLFDNQYRAWTEQLVRQESTGYATKSEFAKLCGTGYNLARKLGILAELGFPDDHPGTANDTIYIWRAVDQYFNGEPIYKIGVTSARLGTARVEQVADGAGFEFELICCQPVSCRATDIEKRLHLLGHNPMFVGFDGATEFRAMSDAVLWVALGLISEVAVKEKCDG